jgi:perosamine synthetase
MGIPVCVPVVPRNAKRYVNLVIEKNWISSLCLDESVNFIKKLEEEFARFVGVKYGVTTTSGTTALQLAIAALGLKPGDEVIVPTFTMIATANAVILNGAIPVFVDADPETWCIDVSLIEPLINERTRAILPVHIYGHPADMDKINELAQKYNLFVIEDAAEAIGTEYKGKKAGSFGDIGCFSFYANKIVTCGEGGILVTDNEFLAQRARKLKDQAFGEPRFIHDEIGFNFRLNNLNAAYAYASFEEVEEYIEKRRRNAQLYNQGLAEVEGVILPPEKSYAKNSYWMYAILIDKRRFGRSKDEVKQLLKSEYGIDTRDFFYPMHKQPVFIKMGYVSPDTKMPVAEKLWEQGLYLPSSTNLTESEISYIVEAIKKLRK